MSQGRPSDQLATSLWFPWLTSLMSLEMCSSKTSFIRAGVFRDMTTDSERYEHHKPVRERSSWAVIGAGHAPKAAHVEYALIKPN